MFWVVCYDIANTKRRNEVVKTLEGYGRRVQFSVFECEIELVQVDRLQNTLFGIVNVDEDSVRFYPLNKADIERIRLLGNARLDLNKPTVIL